MLSELKPVAIQLEAGTEQLSASIADLRPEHWLARIDGRTNHPAFIALHLLEARRYLLGLLGHETTHGFEELVEGAKDLEDIAEYPSRDSLLTAWRRMAEEVVPALAQVEKETLAEAPPFRFPVQDGTRLGAVAFITAHESYHIGQIVLIRRALGLSGAGGSEARGPNSNSA